MKKNLIIATAVIFIFVGCKSATPDKQTAYEILKTTMGYPKVISYDVFTGDPLYIKKMHAAGLEKDGWVTLDSTRKLRDIGKPLIHFTEKSKDFLLPISSEDKISAIQKVVMAYEDIQEITNIQQDGSANSVTVYYTTTIKDSTPFARLAKLDLNKIKNHKISLTSEDGTWKAAKKKKGSD